MTDAERTPQRRITVEEVLEAYRVTGMKPISHAISVEQASYLRDEYGARQERVEEVPRWYLVFMVACALAFVAVMSLAVVWKWWNREAGS